MSGTYHATRLTILGAELTVSLARLDLANNGRIAQQMLEASQAPANTREAFSKIGLALARVIDNLEAGYDEANIDD
jgi:hypothetical protein